MVATPSMYVPLDVNYMRDPRIRLEKVEPVLTEHIEVETPPLMEVTGA